MTKIEEDPHEEDDEMEGDDTRKFGKLDNGLNHDINIKYFYGIHICEYLLSIYKENSYT